MTPIPRSVTPRRRAARSEAGGEACWKGGLAGAHARSRPRGVTWLPRDGGALGDLPLFAAVEPRGVAAPGSCCRRLLSALRCAGVRYGRVGDAHRAGEGCGRRRRWPPCLGSGWDLRAVVELPPLAVYDEEDYRRIRFVGRQKEVNRNFAIDLIAEQPVSEVESRVISCDGGGGALGHPKVYINLDKDTKTGTCGYCGLQFKQKHH
ncbi:NADH dehydrogenase [ubiquinone] iron-sulfur protein 6, mitochondrial isoform X1 [Dromaius novaehollandiae]|uniref:NADH dehydrogenase [ubiquinone] iron-sulfur protein 6, mitochondrial isoform X1 n=1 Tax=Dromaius novaehollandiae TaxID=8790 RepID=UPI00311F2AE4